MSHGWWVLVEASSGGDEEWQLKNEIHAPEGREQAIALAEEQTAFHIGRYRQPADTFARKVYRISETEWLVRVTHNRWSEVMKRPTSDGYHYRVSVAELVSVTEAVPVQAPPKKGLFGRRKG